MGIDVWLDMDRVIQDQLALQVELSFRRHHNFMAAHGLDRCRDVVDVGTGNGQFLREVAALHPATRFHGIDNKSHMVDAAKSHARANIEWVMADAMDSETSRLLGKSDGAIMRYFVLHLPETRVSLQKMLSSLRDGTRLWVMDLDIDHCRCEPPNSAFSEFVNLVQAFCDREAVAIKTGTMLPPILEACGFEVDALMTEPFNNREIDPMHFADYLCREASLYHYSLYGTPGTEELRPLREFLVHQACLDSQFVQYGMVMLSAQKRSS